MIYLRPVLPQLSMEAAKFLNATDKMEWKNLAPLPAGHKIEKFKHLMKRVEKEQVTALIKSPEEKAAAVGDGLIDIADFSRMDLRVAVVKEAATVDGADKLLHLTLDVGDGRLRSVFAGIKQHYVSDALIGRGVVYLANLRPRKMRFGVSEGMVLAASNGEDVILLSVADGVPAGAR
ncbi:MAG: methionine--tRNA ligase subunit beta [Candidatus Zeuxoniibacter abyssi]|nr:MAG: methionine--tRNA ligase subunit beta [Candidatus Persebacteraceae bacterium AB1(2)]